jgi:Lipocalin-like domain
LTANPLVGTWRLVSYIARDEDGGVTYPVGEDAVGFIIYTDDGYMAVQFGGRDRPRLSIPDFKAVEDSEVATSVRDFIAYAGAYEIRDGTTVHHLELSLMPNWIGQDFVRAFDLEGDCIILSTPPVLIDGRKQVGTLTWRRV